MKLITRIGVLLLTLLMCATMFVPMVVMADGEDATETANGCNVTLRLKDFQTEETDNIYFRVKNTDTKVSTEVAFLKINNWETSIVLPAGEYQMVFDHADNKREIQLDNKYIKVPNAKSALAELTVKKVVNNNFLPKFFRNNTFTLILLVAAIVAYVILKKRREAGLM